MKIVFRLLLYVEVWRITQSCPVVPQRRVLCMKKKKKKRTKWAHVDCVGSNHVLFCGGAPIANDTWQYTLICFWTGQNQQQFIKTTYPSANTRNSSCVQTTGSRTPTKPDSVVDPGVGGWGSQIQVVGSILLNNGRSICPRSWIHTVFS